MRRLSGIGVAVLLAVVLLAGCGSAGGGAGGSSDRLPAVTLASLTGGPSVDLRTLRGPTVVNLWASWCGPCKRELPLYADFARAHAGRVSVLGIDFQDARSDAALAMMKRSRVQYPVLRDFDGVMRVIGLPKVILLDAHGRIVFSEYVEITSVAQIEALVRTHLGAVL